MAVRVGLRVRRGPAELPGREAGPVAPAPVVEPVQGAGAALAERLDREAQQREVLPARVAFQEGLAPLDLGSPRPAVWAAELVRQEGSAEREAAGRTVEPAARDPAARATRAVLVQSAQDRAASASRLCLASPCCSVCEEEPRAGTAPLVVPLRSRPSRRDGSVRI